MALSIVQHSNAIHTAENPPSAVTLAGAPTAGNLLIAFIGVNTTSYTVGTGWTQFDGVTTNSNFPQLGTVMVALYRYAQIGDTATLPAFFSAASTYWTHQIYEVSGVSGTWNTDFLFSCPLPLTESNANIVPLKIPASGLALTGTASYNGTTNPTISGSWTRDDANNNNSNYGSAAGAHRAVTTGDVLDGAWTQGTSTPYGAIVMVLTTVQTSSGVFPRHVFRCGGNSGFTGTITLPFVPKIGNLLIAYVPYGNAFAASPTISGNWTQFASASDGAGKKILSLYRYAQSGDDTLPALFTAAGDFQEFMLVELGGGISGTFASDHVSNKSGTQDTGTNITTTSDTTTANGQFAMLAYGNYNGGTNATTTGFDGYLIQNNDGSYGSYFLAFKYVATSGTTVQGTITPSLTTTPQSYSQDIFNFGVTSTSYTLTSAQGSYSLSGQALLFHRTVRMASAQGAYSLNGQATSAGHSRTLAATRGVYHLNGKPVAKHHQRRLRANVGRYRYRREVVRLRRNATQVVIFPVDTGEYTLIGEDAVFGSLVLRSTFSEFLDTGYLDWNSLGGADYVSYLDTYYLKTDDIMAKLTTPYIYVFVENASDASLILNVVKNWAETGNTPEIGTPIQCYRFRDGFLLSVTKNRIRGRGRVMQLRFTSETGKPFNLRGWAAWITQNANP